MVIRKGKRGPFVACSGFPRCRKTMPMERLEEAKAKVAAGHGGSDDGAAGVEAGEEGSAGGSAGTKRASSRASHRADAKGAAADANPAIGKTRSGKLVVESLDVPVDCPECGNPMQLRPGRWGPFMACTGYPKCKGTARLKGKALEQAKESVPASGSQAQAGADGYCLSRVRFEDGRPHESPRAVPRVQRLSEVPPYDGNAGTPAEQIRKRVEAESKA